MISYFDWHCDTLSKLSGYLVADEYHITRNATDMFKKYVQVFAVYTSGKLDKYVAYNNALKQLDAFDQDIIGKYGFNRCDKKRAILSIENCGCLKNNIATLEEFYNRGVRVISLTHNQSNRFACGSSESVDTGLTALGKDLFKHAQNMNMIIDVSHLSFKSFWDILAVTQKPVIATHSCSYALCKHPRNLTDDMYRAICSCGGLVGINLYPDFIGKYDLCEHIMRFGSIGGYGHIAFGCDFDGVDKLPNGIKGLKDIHKFVNNMKNNNFSDDIVEDIYYNNSIKFFKNYVGE